MSVTRRTFTYIKTWMRKYVGNGQTQGDQEQIQQELKRTWAIRICAIIINFSIVISMLSWTSRIGKRNDIPTAPLGLKDLCAPLALELGDTDQCENACHPASCCWGDTVEDNCLHMNEELCAGYSYCEDLKYHFDAKGIQPSWTTPELDMPPDSIHWNCATDDNGVLVNEDQCLKHCQPASCCFELSKHLNCVSENKDACAAYKDFCSKLPPEGFLADYDGSIPPAPNSLSFVCSKESIQESDANYDMCITFCSPALCCVGQGNLANCADPGHENQCKEYAPYCKHVWPYSDELAENHSEYIEKYDVPSPVSALCDDKKLTWDVNANNYCKNACSYGECCWTSGNSNCEDEFGPICAEYHACPEYQNNVQPVTEDWFVPDPSLPMDELCSVSSVLTTDGLKACADACSKASCCFDSRKNNCADELSAICDLYHPCKFLPKENKQIATMISPPVDNICSEKNLRSTSGRELCEAICEPAACCFDHPPYNCFDDNPARCREYDGCRAMTDVPPAPRKMADLCSEDILKLRGYDLLLCEDACRPGTCCYEPEPGNCFQQNGKTCEGYEPCSRLSSSDGFDFTPLHKVCSPDNISVGDGGIECAEECAVAACCYKPGSEGCFDSQPNFCNAYMPYCTTVLGAQALGIIQKSKIDEIVAAEDDDQEFEEEMDPLKEICSKDNVMTEEGRKQCEDECVLVACCLAEGPFSCLEENKNYCDSHVGVCEILEDGSGSIISFAPPDLEETCSFDNIVSMDGLAACEKACAPSSCCFRRGGSNCGTKNKAECDSYSICEIVGST